ncbi:ras-like protein [Anaeramoeba ignava]|uniref:small monomeric GTPase n=1 Tax=Anaeramoeba ignava TaxID=1746090 RepID=A0A9Q0RB96_ANAIG|nr:ras-like protein [Anaeramoeba ignava]|eukprot:Anaeramoba_ignava/a219774_74.p1 GENE.a219774_74~~a219774_74.p1  ORF type:complete len:188 (-),score=53.15 a219774_74:8-571(-)
MPSYKVVVVGGGGVGKTALTIQFVHSKFIEVYEATIEDSYRRQVQVDEQVVNLDILDTAGQEEYAVIRDTHLRSGDGFLVVFAISSKDSFDEVPNFIEQIQKAKETNEFPLVLVGNKSDQESLRQVTRKEAENYAKVLNCLYIETSAKLRHNVDEIFHSITKRIRSMAGESPQLGPKPPKKKRCLIL